MHAVTRRGLVVVGAMALLCAPMRASAELSVLSEVDTDRLGVEDQVHLTITFTGDPMPPQVPMPTLTNLAVVGGPMTSSQISFVNGAVTRSQVLTLVLQPRAPGKAEIGAVHVKFANVDQSAPPIKLEIVPGSIRPK